MRSNLNQNRQRYFSNQNTDQIQEIYFARVSVTSSGRVELIDETPLIERYPDRTIESEFRYDSNKNGNVDPDENSLLKQNYLLLQMAQYYKTGMLRRVLQKNLIRAFGRICQAMANSFLTF